MVGMKLFIRITYKAIFHKGKKLELLANKPAPALSPAIPFSPPV